MSVRHVESLLRRTRLRARHVAPASPSALMHTVEALASFGEKRVGTAAGAHAAAYLHDRMRGAGLAEVGFEEFRFPRHDVHGARLRIDGRELGFDVFEGACAGSVDAELVACGAATEEALDALDVELAGRIAVVERNPFYHRSTQYRNVSARGARAMIGVSAAPENLRQVGSVRRGFEAVGDLPAVTIGAADGAAVVDRLLEGARIRAQLEVDAASTPATGANLLGHIGGRERGRIVVGAHYDTWFTGATDNGGGVAAMLALAELWAARETPRYGLSFVAWDGEEVALYGGYDFLRRHVVEGGGEPVLAVIDLETPSARGGQFHGLARSGCPCLDHALRAGGLDHLYPGYLPMSVVPEIFGGVIPTDVQGLHRAGVAAAATAVDAPYYHTTGDTPERLDAAHLARAVEGFDRALAALMLAPADAFGVRDDAEQWRAEVNVERDAARVVVRDADGVCQPGVPVEAQLLADDFFLEAETVATTDAHGEARLVLPAASAGGLGSRWLHVGAGPRHPLVEAVVRLDQQEPEPEAATAPAPSPPAPRTPGAPRDDW